MSRLPETGVEYNLRVYEIQCAGSDVERWYWLDVWVRTLVVAAYMLPMVVKSLRDAGLPSASILH